MQVATVTKHGLRWDESAHPRHNDGKFRPKGSAAEGNGHAKPQTAPAPSEQDDPQLQLMFAVRDELVAPQWENPLPDTAIAKWAVGTGPDEQHYHLAYYHGRVQQVNADADDALENIFAGALQKSGAFADAGIGEVCFYQDLAPGSSQVTATGGGNARAVFRHVIGAVSDLMKRGEGIIIFTGASDQHDKLYSNLMRLMGRSDPRYVAIATQSAGGGNYFALVRRDIYDHIEGLARQLTDEDVADIEEAAEELRGLQMQRFSARDGWGLPIKYGAKWDESQHPRDPKGMFTEKGQGGAKMATRTTSIDTPEFKKWFGNSKVVDKQGQPLVVYHGTGGEPTSFNTGLGGINTGARSAKQAIFFVNDPEVASGYAVTSEDNRLHPATKHIHEQISAARDQLQSMYPLTTPEKRQKFDELLKQELRLKRELRSTRGPRQRLQGTTESGLKYEWINNPQGTVMPVFLKMENPLEHDFKGRDYRDKRFTDLVNEARAGGHDGLILKNVYDSPLPTRNPHDVYAVFKPTQIKSATGNRGTFDAKNDDIRFATRPHGERFSVRSRSVEDFYSHATEMSYEFLAEFDRRQPGQKAQWKYVSFPRVKKIWEDYAKDGMVRNEKGMQAIADRVVDNIALMTFMTEMDGRTMRDPHDVYENLTGEEITEEQLDEFSEWAGLHSSDYLMEPLQDLALQIMEAKSAEEQLQLVDRVFNTVHMSSDLLAENFIQGGKRALSQLSGTGEYGSATHGPDGERLRGSSFATRPKPENGIDPIDNLLGGSQGYLYKGGKLRAIEGEHAATVGPIDKAVQAGAVRIRDHGQFVAFQGRSKATVDAAIKAYVRDVGVPKKITAEWPGRFYEDYQGGGTSFAARAHDASGMRAANATSRPGAFSSKAVVPKIVADHLAAHPQGKQLTVLDFGAGTQAAHAQALKARGYHVTAYDFGSNVGEQHDPQALERQYDVIYASNVLNVQETAQMLSKTLSEIRESTKPGGTVFVNLPKPLNGIWRNRKPASARRLMEQILRKRLGTPEQVQPGVWKVTVPDSKAKKYSRVSGDRLAGGNGDQRPVRSFDPQQLLLGTMIEMEHTRNVRLAQEIARDHLTANPRYYQLLTRFVEEPTARPAGENVLRGWRQPGMFSMRGQAEKYRASADQPRSPTPHGVTIGGQFYPPGQWIPAGAMAQATQKQRHAIATNDSTHATADEPDPDTSHLGVEPVALLKRLQRQGLLAHADLAFGHGGIVAQVNGRQFVIRVAREGELEQLWRNDPGSAAASAAAGGMGHIAAIAGAYREGQIILADDFTDGEMNHELIHALRDLGIIKQADIDLWGGEEQMAYAYQRWTDKRLSLAKPVEGTFQRIRDFVLALFGNEAAKQRQTLRRFDQGKLQPGVNWAKVGHRAALMALAAHQVRRNWPQIKQQRKAVQDYLYRAAYGGNYRNSREGIEPGDVNPQDPTSGIDEQGFINTAAILFATREWEPWLKRLEEDPATRGMYSQHDLQELRTGMEATARIFGDFSQLPPEEGTQYEAWTTKQGKLRYRVVGDKGHSPIRKNSDALFVQTFDLSTVCPKQDFFLAVCKAAQHVIGTVFGKEARHIISRVIDHLGFESPCYVCYGQSSRNNAAQSLKSVSEVMWPAWQQLASTPNGRRLLAAPPTDPQKQVVMEQIFSNQLGEFYWYNKKDQKHSLIYQAFTKYAGDKEVQDLMSKPPVIHDLFFAQYAGPPLTKTQAEFFEMIRESVQGGLKPNMPKGWASYDRQLLSSTAKASIDAYNKSAGFRMNSQTDLRPWHVIDTSQFLTHLQAQGGMAHVYTRVPAFVEVFGGTGIKFNLSCGYAHKMDGSVMRDKGTGKPVWDMKSFPQQQALAYRKKYPGEVGSMLVATSMDALMTGLDDPDIDMMIPYHAGSVPQSVDTFEGYEDFTPFQHEQWPKGKHSKGEVVQARVKVRGQIKTIRLQWEHPITREHHNDDKERYLALCDALQVVPRFPQLCGRGQLWHGGPKAQEHPLASVNIDHPNYMKVVRDVAITHTPQRPVDARKINWQAAEAVAQEYIAKAEKGGEVSAPQWVVDTVVDTLRGKAPIPPSPVGKDVTPAGLPILDVKRSARHDQLVRRVTFRLNKEIARVRYSAARGGRSFA